MHEILANVHKTTIEKLKCSLIEVEGLKLSTSTSFFSYSIELNDGQFSVI